MLCFVRRVVRLSTQRVMKEMNWREFCWKRIIYCFSSHKNSSFFFLSFLVGGFLFSFAQHNFWKKSAQKKEFVVVVVVVVVVPRQKTTAMEEKKKKKKTTTTRERGGLDHDDGANVRAGGGDLCFCARQKSQVRDRFSISFFYKREVYLIG